ncbi:MAG: hypothetical protein TEF_03915 [Rhizobiales bacterium NRL2]|jgi:hypothetical protein|nr:MAG: hypothetical protein TEF_03915 [Rhizobiales bacterium NRL2]
MSEPIVRVGAHLVAFILAVVTIGLSIGIVVLSERESLEVDQPALLSSRFPESIILRSAVRAGDSNSGWCARGSMTNGGASRIARYAAISPNDAKLLLALAERANDCGVVSETRLLLRRALMLGASDPRVVIGAYKFRRFLEHTDAELAEVLDRKLIYLWDSHPSYRRDIADVIGKCWSCKQILAKAHPEFAGTVTEYGRKKRR